MDPLSNLHLRPSELALVKIVNINMDKTKISEFIREQRMATDNRTRPQESICTIVNTTHNAS